MADDVKDIQEEVGEALTEPQPEADRPLDEEITMAEETTPVEETTPIEEKSVQISSSSVQIPELEERSETQKQIDTPLPEAKLEERGAGSKKLSGHIVISKTTDPRARWYVVHTTSGHEARVAESLKQRIQTLGITEKVFEVLIPTQDRVVIRSGRKVTVKEKIFPGYLLVKMILDEDAWLGVRTTQGVTGFVGAGNKPTPLSNAEVENIEKFTSAPAARYKVRFSVGEAVKITDGPFAEFLGTINEMDEEKGKVKVMVSIFGRETPVELDFLQIAKV